MGCSRFEPTSERSTDGTETPATSKTRTSVEATPAVGGLTEAQRAEVLVQVGPDVMTLGHFVDSLGPDLQRWAELNGAESAYGKMREVLARTERYMLLWEPARAAGFDQVPHVQRLRKERMLNLLRDALVAETRPDYHRVSNEDLAAYHAAHQDEFTIPAAVRVAHVLFDDAAEAQAVLADLLAADDPNTVFSRLGIARVKNLGLVPRDPAFPVEPPAGQHRAMRMAQALRAAVSELTAQGQILPRTVETPAGFHILRCTGVRKARVRPAIELAKTLHSRIMREREQALYAGLLPKLETEADLEIIEDNLGKVRVGP